MQNICDKFQNGYFSSVNIFKWEFDRAQWCLTSLKDDILQ